MVMGCKFVASNKRFKEIFLSLNIFSFKVSFDSSTIVLELDDLIIGSKIGSNSNAFLEIIGDNDNITFEPINTCSQKKREA